MYCSVPTLVLSTVGSYTSDSTPPATVYQTFDVVFCAVPTHSLRPRSKNDIEPGPPGASAAGAAAAPLAGPDIASRPAATVSARPAAWAPAVIRFMPPPLRPRAITAVSRQFPGQELPLLRGGCQRPGRTSSGGVTARLP